MSINSPEGIILSIVVGILFIAYAVIYPFFVGPKLEKWLVLDVLFSILALIIVGCLFWGADFRFKLPFIGLNWFWFTLLAYGIIEIPLAIWYANKHKLWETAPSLKNDDE